MKMHSIRSFLIVSFLMTITACGLFKPGPSQVVKNFYRDVEEGKIEAATKLFSSQFVQAFGSKLSAGMSRQNEEIKNKGGIKTIDTEEEITGDLAKVNYTVTYGNNSTEKGVVNLIKENGEWKIQLSQNK